MTVSAIKPVGLGTVLWAAAFLPTGKCQLSFQGLFLCGGDIHESGGYELC